MGPVFRWPSRRGMVRAPRAVLVLAFLTGPAWGQSRWISALETPVTEDFNSLAASGLSSVVPTGWYFVESGTAPDGLYRADTGTNTAGDTYSYGLTGSAERAFGALRSNALSTIRGAAFTNGTGATIGSLGISYTGEQWRLGAITGRADRIDFQYSLDATQLTSGTWTDVDALDFSSPVVTGAAAGALNGNAPSSRTSLSGWISPLSIAPDATFWIRWLDLDVSGADDGLAVDDFSLTAYAGPVGVSEAPLGLALERAGPHPARGARLSVRIVLPSAAPARLELLDIGGRRVLEREVGALGQGRHTLELDAGRRLAPGVYLVRLAQGAQARTIRTVMLN